VNGLNVTSGKPLQSGARGLWLRAAGRGHRERGEDVQGPDHTHGGRPGKEQEAIPKFTNISMFCVCVIGRSLNLFLNTTQHSHDTFYCTSINEKPYMTHFMANAR
jgi:hypothetical protein